jgi:hypothetical protein
MAFFITGTITIATTISVTLALQLPQTETSDSMAKIKRVLEPYLSL